MPTPIFLGEFEQFVLLSILRLGESTPVLELRDEMEELADRSISRGSIYRTLDRLEDKGWVTWDVDDEDIPERGGRPRRQFRVTEKGVAVLRDSRETLEELWDGLEGALG